MVPCLTAGGRIRTASVVDRMRLLHALTQIRSARGRLSGHTISS